LKSATSCCGEGCSTKLIGKYKGTGYCSKCTKKNLIESNKCDCGTRLTGKYKDRGKCSPCYKKENKDIYKQISSDLRNEVWDKYIGKDRAFAQCQNCQDIELDKTKIWHCSHIVAKAKGGELSADNLVPLCVDCNMKIGTSTVSTETVERWKNFLKNIKKNKNRAQKHGKLNVDIMAEQMERLALINEDSQPGITLSDAIRVASDEYEWEAWLTMRNTMKKGNKVLVVSPSKSDSLRYFQCDGF